MTDDGVIERTDEVHIANEFTTIDVCVAHTPGGARLELRNQKTGNSVLLDAMHLEILTTQDPETFSDLFSSEFDAQRPD